MKKLLFILMITPAFALGQYDSTKIRQNINAYGYNYKNIKAGTLIAGVDTPKMARKDSGALAYKGGVEWVYTGDYWKQISGSGGADSATIMSYILANKDTFHIRDADTNFLKAVKISPHFWELQAYLKTINGQSLYGPGNLTISGGGGWSLTGNAASAGDFLGTTNGQPLLFKQNNRAAGYVGGSNNTHFGDVAGIQTAVDNGGFANASFGTGAQRFGSNNTNIGAFSGNDNPTATKNTFLGTSTGNYLKILDASANVGSENTFVGYGAGGSWDATFQHVNGFGKYGDGNTLVGSKVGSNYVGFDKNIGSHNTWIGHDIIYTYNNPSNTIALGQGVNVVRDNSMTIGINTYHLKALGIANYSGNHAGYVLKDTSGFGDFKLMPDLTGGGGGATPSLADVTAVGNWSPTPVSAQSFNIGGFTKILNLNDTDGDFSFHKNGDDFNVFEVNTSGSFFKFAPTAFASLRFLAPTEGTYEIQHFNKTSTAPVYGMYYCNCEYADNAAAVLGGLEEGTVYRTGDVLKIVHQ